MSGNQRTLVRMTHDEARSFLERGRTATTATIGPGGFRHLVAMWCGLVGGRACFETKGWAPASPNGDRAGLQRYRRRDARHPQGGRA